MGGMECLNLWCFGWIWGLGFGKYRGLNVSKLSTGSYYWVGCIFKGLVEKITHIR